jgi:Zn-dependent protease with chaperone function
MKRILIGLAFAATSTGCAISTQQEVQLGTDYAQQINAQLPIVKDPEIVRYINVLGDSIAKLADDRSLDWQFFVVNAPEVNAFAVPGGYIYINRGAGSTRRRARSRDRSRHTPSLRAANGEAAGRECRRDARVRADQRL